MFGLIVGIIFFGLIAGALARLLVRRQHMSISTTILLGVVGSFVGGFLGYLVFHTNAQQGFIQPAGMLGSVVGAVSVLLIWGRLGDRQPSNRQPRSRSGLFR